MVKKKDIYPFSCQFNVFDRWLSVKKWSPNFSPIIFGYQKLFSRTSDHKQPTNSPHVAHTICQKTTNDMPKTTRQVARLAGVSEQTTRNYTREYGELLSPQARGEAGPRLFSDEDVRIFCAIADLRKSGVPPAEVIERVRAGNIVIDVTPQEATPSHTTSPQTSLDPPHALMLVQRRMDALERRQDTLLRAAVLWGALLGAIAALAGAAFLVWLLWLTSF